MRKLYQYPLCPLSRQARIYLKELGVEFTMIKQDYWQRNLEFSSLSPTAILPILQETSYTPIFGIYPITEYLYEKYQDFSFMDKTIEVKCEIRRLLSWFNEKLIEK